MTKPNQFTAVESEVDIQRARKLIIDVIEDVGNFRPEWIAGRDWMVVPFASADHFNKTDIELLAMAFRKAGHDEILAVATESLYDTPVCYKVPTTEEGLRRLNEAIRDFCFILIPEDRSCAVLCTKDDDYLIGGPLQFVLLALRTSIAEARAAFVAFAETCPHPQMRKGHLDMAARYEHTGPSGSSAFSQQLLPPPSQKA